MTTQSLNTSFIIDNGSLWGWLINPQNNQVEIYRKGQAVELLEHPIELSGENILPGFSLNLKRVMGYKEKESIYF